MEMARKHEHFGLSYLEELAILKERENICKESRQEFLKFKQKADSVQGNLNKPTLEVIPDLSCQLEPNSLQSPQIPFVREITDLPVQWDTSRSLKTSFSLSSDISAVDYQTQHLKTQQKKSPKKEDSRVGSHLDEDEKGPVAITSLLGTARQVSMLKKPEPPPKSKYRKTVRIKSVSEKHFIPQNDSEQPEQKIYSQIKTTGTTGASSVTKEIDSSSAMYYNSSEKPFKKAKDISKPLNSILESERAYGRKTNEVSNVKSVSGSSQETRGKRSKIYEKPLLWNESQIQDSAQKFSAGVVPRSIDEIIASLQSTVPTPSDLRIKELLESVLGHDYSIKIEVGELE